MTKAILTTKDLVAAFGVTSMTISNWRKGSPTKTALPTKQRGRFVCFEPERVQRWANSNSVPILAPKKLAGGAERLKPGPKSHSAQKSL